MSDSPPGVSDTCGGEDTSGVPASALARSMSGFYLLLRELGSCCCFEWKVFGSVLQRGGFFFSKAMCSVESPKRTPPSAMLPLFHVEPELGANTVTYNKVVWSTNG